MENKIIDLHDSLVGEGKNVEKVELRKYLDDLLGKSRKCEVCAKGAMFLSAVRKFNNFSLDDAVIVGDNIWSSSSCTLDDNASDEIRKIFGKANADLIEEYFEKSDPYKTIKDDDGDSIDVKWSWGYDDTERLILILKNVVANKGQFKPKQLTWVSRAKMLEFA